MIVEISNQREKYLNNVGIHIDEHKLKNKNLVRLIANNNTYGLNLNAVDLAQLDNRHRTLKNQTGKTIMNRLFKQSNKVYRHSTNKNKQEERRLDFEQTMLEKNYAHEDAVWLREFVKVNDRLQDIRLKSSTSTTRTNCPTRATTTMTTNDDFSDDCEDYYSLFSDTDGSSIRTVNGQSLLSIKSYTSMIGSSNDRTKEQLETYRLKHVPYIGSANRSNIATSLFKRESHGRSEDQLSELVSNRDDGESLTEMKSIRRPLRNASSARDIVNKLKSLENKVNYYRTQNRANNRIDDRNVRYGGPLPRREIYRQLRILSKFDNVVK